jgi:ribosomal protein L37AE/L43A
MYRGQAKCPYCQKKKDTKFDEDDGFWYCEVCHTRWRPINYQVQILVGHGRDSEWVDYKLKINGKKVNWNERFCQKVLELP